MATNAVTAQTSLDNLDNVFKETEERLERTSSESTFTKHTNKIHALIKELLMGVIIIIQMVILFKNK